MSGAGTYSVQLVTANATSTSSAKTLTIKVNPALGWDPAVLRFDPDIRTILQTGSGNCTSCHISTKNPSTDAQTPPIFYNDFDRSGTGNAATNLHWFYTELRGRINFTDIVASPLLRKPSGNHHGGGAGALNGFKTSFPVGDSAREDYDKILAWILNGAPE